MKWTLPIISIAFITIALEISVSPSIFSDSISKPVNPGIGILNYLEAPLTGRSSPNVEQKAESKEEENAL